MADSAHKKAIDKKYRESGKAKISQDKYRKTKKYRISYISNHLKRTYGITIEDYNEILQAQGGVCAICKEVKKRKFKKKTEEFLPLFVDHCHKTEEVRGLLCTKCNAGIGMFDDSINLLVSAIAYLKE